VGNTLSTEEIQRLFNSAWTGPPTSHTPLMRRLMELPPSAVPPVVFAALEEVERRVEEERVAAGLAAATSAQQVRASNRS